jgi:hypothetical protein
MACVSASCSTFIAWDVRFEVRTGAVGMETGRQETAIQTRMQEGFPERHEAIMSCLNTLFSAQDKRLEDIA